MTAAEIKKCTTSDLKIEYFNIREYLKFEYLRAAFPTIMFTAMIALHSQIPQSDDAELERWISLLWPYLTAVTAFVCAFGIVYFGGRAWRATKVAIAIHSELLNRAG